MKRVVLLLILVIFAGCEPAPAPRAATPFGSDPAYASCVVDNGPDSAWCPGAPATVQPYYCATPAPPGHGCTGGMTYLKTNPAPAEILCCPISGAADGGIGDAAADAPIACSPSPPHSITTIEDGGVCALSGCEAGYGDCDGSIVNGCETLCPASGAPCCTPKSCTPGSVCSDGTGGTCAAVCSDAGMCTCSPPFARDPAYSSCAESDDYADNGCPVGVIPYLCSVPVASPQYGCVSAPTTAPVGLICCP